jgi:hypothetical protein
MDKFRNPAILSVIHHHQNILNFIILVAKIPHILTCNSYVSILKVFWSYRLCGLVVRVLGYRSGAPGSIPGTTRKKKVVGLERGPLSLVSTTEELLDRKVAAPV